MNRKRNENNSFRQALSTVASLERSAAAASRAISSDLLSPTSLRGDLTPAVELLSQRFLSARRVVDRLRRQTVGIGRTEALALKAAEVRLQHWGAVTRAVMDCLAGHEWPLMPEAPSPLDLGAAQGALMSEAFTRAHRAFNTASQHPDAASQGAFDDIPLDTSRFIAAVHLAYRIRLATKSTHPWRFLDVGCGGGMKVALGADFFDEATGIEIDPGFVEAAHRTFASMGSRRCNVIEADAMTYDGYGRFNVIFLYRPTHNLDALMAIEQRILEQSQARAILIAPYRSFAMRATRLGCKHMGGCVYLKIPSARRMSTLIAEVRRMGPHVFGPDHDPPQGLGWLRPLWLACVANGILPARAGHAPVISAPAREPVAQRGYLQKKFA